MSAEFQSKPRSGENVPHDHGEQQRSGFGTVFAMLFTMCVVVSYLPLSTSLPASNLDSAWQWVMNEVVARHMVFGRDIVFTFGPFASVYTRQYHPATNALDMGASLLIGLAFATGLLSLARGRHKWLLAVVIVAILLNNILRDAFYMALPSLLLVLTVRLEMRKDFLLALRPSTLTWVAQLLLVASLAILPLIKGSFGALSIALGGVCFVLQWQSNRTKASLGAFIFFMTMVGSWVVAGQPLDALPYYFLAMRPIISGYTEAMSTMGHRSEIVIYILSALCVVGAAFWAAARSLRLPGLCLVIGLALALFIAFKAGFVRHDAHALIAMGTLVFVAIFVAFFCSQRTALVLVVLAIGSFLFVDNHYTPFSTMPARMSNSVKLMVDGIERGRDGGSFMRAAYEQNVATMRSAFTLPDLPGSWDVYSVNQDLALANNVPWSPRPVFQSYSAYGEQLEQLNAAHLLGPSAPDNILFAVSTIDERLPALDDGLSWPILFSRYLFEGMKGQFAILRKRANAPSAVTSSLSKVSTTLNASVAVPASDMGIWARVDLKPSVAGRFASTLFATPELRIEYTFADGTTSSYRYIPSMGAVGFFVSPIVRDTGDFVKLMTSRQPGVSGATRAVSFRIVPTHHSAWAWSRTMSIEFSSVTTPVTQ